MNWLAHIFVSKPHIDYQLGNLLADSLKTRIWERASQELHAGVRMHRRIDAYADQHPIFRRSKSRLGNKGVLKAVVVDITYDHLLLNHWEQFSSISSTQFLHRFHQRAERAVVNYPDAPRQFVQRLIRSNHLASYGSTRGLEAALGRVDDRLSQRVLARDTVSRYIPIVNKVMPAIEQDFLEFFPQLICRFKQEVGDCGEEHWLR